MMLRSNELKKQYETELSELVYQVSFYQIITGMQLDLMSYLKKHGETDKYKEAKKRLDKLKDLAFGFDEFFKQNAENWNKYDFYRLECCKLLRENANQKKEIEKLTKVLGF